MSEIERQLSEIERGELEECESVIERGQKTFIEVGNALSKIRDGKLYRQTHKTFEAYCRERWGMTKDFANKQVRAVPVVENLKTNTIVSILPTAESQVRPLTKLDGPKKQQKAWAKAVEMAGGKVPTAAIARGE